jgi:hypothetical protein
MSEHSERPAEGTPPPGERGTPPSEARTAPPPPPSGEGDVIGTAPAAAGPYTPAGERPPSRFRRWSANASVRTGAVALVAGLVGGLAGGGIVAAFSGDDHDHVRPVRVERGMPRGGPGFHGPRHWGPGGPQFRQFRQPAQPPQPAPTPSPRTTG